MIHMNSSSPIPIYNITETTNATASTETSEQTASGEPHVVKDSYGHKYMACWLTCYFWVPGRRHRGANHCDWCYGAGFVQRLAVVTCMDIGKGFCIPSGKNWDCACFEEHVEYFATTATLCKRILTALSSMH